MEEELNAAKESDLVEYPPVARVVMACAIESNIGIPAPHNINDHITVNVIYTNKPHWTSTMDGGTFWGN